MRLGIGSLLSGAAPLVFLCPASEGSVIFLAGASSILTLTSLPSPNVRGFQPPNPCLVRGILPPNP